MSLDLTHLPRWPVGNIKKQSLYFERLKTEINNLYNLVIAQTGVILLLEQTTEPLQAEWEAEYLIQTGQSPPLPANSTLVWWDTGNNRLGGYYTTVQGKTDVYAFEPAYAPGTIINDTFVSVDAARTNGTNINVQVAPIPSLTINIPVRCTLNIVGFAPVDLTGEAGMDFLVNGEKIGTTRFEVNSDTGLVTTENTHPLTAEVSYEVEPGDYNISMLIGPVNGSTGSVSYGGTLGPTVLRAWGLIL